MPFFLGFDVEWIHKTKYLSIESMIFIEIIPIYWYQVFWIYRYRCLIRLLDKQGKTGIFFYRSLDIQFLDTGMTSFLDITFKTT